MSATYGLRGLKIEAFALSALCVAYQISCSYLGKSPQFTNFFCLSEREQKWARSCTNSCTVFAAAAGVARFARVTIWSVCKTPVIRQNSGECKLSDGPIVLESRPAMFTDFAKIDIRSADNAIELFREFLVLTSWTQIFLSHLPGLSNRLLCCHPR
jgi:hypothetical protein